MKTKPKAPPPGCKQCGKPTEKECGRVECANRKPITVDAPSNWDSFTGKINPRWMDDE
jgi:hypothetical protein